MFNELFNVFLVFDVVECYFDESSFCHVDFDVVAEFCAHAL